jgi:hypothetical protein
MEKFSSTHKYDSQNKQFPLIKKIQNAFFAFIFKPTLYIHNSGQMQGVESRRHSSLFQGFRNDADGLK